LHTAGENFQRNRKEIVPGPQLKHWQSGLEKLGGGGEKRTLFRESKPRGKVKEGGKG